MSTITFRTDAEVDRALADLMSAGIDRSQTIRDAILTAWRLHEEQLLRAEAERLAADPDDTAEARQVLADMESLRAW
jgi:hypothetical protein